MTALVIRYAAATDEAVWRQLWHQYLVFYEKGLPEDVTAYTWARLLDPATVFGCRLAEQDGTVIGFANHLLHEGTWSKQLNCYLEDLFVDPSARRNGTGRALIDDLVTMGRAKSWAQLYWHTQNGNGTARRLYDSYGPSLFVRYAADTGSG